MEILLKCVQTYTRQCGDNFAITISINKLIKFQYNNATIQQYVVLSTLTINIEVVCHEMFRNIVEKPINHSHHNAQSIWHCNLFMNNK